MNIEILLVYLATFIVGSVVGSFLNVVIYRLPSVASAGINSNATQSIFYLAWPLSFCTSCSEHIKPWHNIPLISYVVLGGKSSCCKKSISWRYPVIELIGAIIPVICLSRFGISSQMLFASLFGWILLSACTIDINRFILPDILILPLLWLGLVVNMNNIFVPLNDAVAGAAAGFLFMFFVSEGTALATSKRMLGGGDPKLFAAIGAWLGWQFLPGTLIIASLSACLFHLIRFVLNKNKGGSSKFIAFGPHLGAAGMIMLIFGYVVAQYHL